MALTINSAQYNSGAEYDTVTGEIVTIDNAKPYVRMKQVVCEVNPVQAGSGDPSPDNVRPITGWSEAKVVRTGKNLLGGVALGNSVVNGVNDSQRAFLGSDTYGDYVAISAGPSLNSKRFATEIKFKENTRYTFIFKMSRYTSGTKNSNMVIVYTDGTSDGINISASSDTDIPIMVIASRANKTVESLETVYGGGTTYLYYDESGIFEGVLTAADFVPYLGTTYTISLGDTRYGAVLDVTRGKLRVTHGMVTFNGSESWTYSGNYGFYTPLHTMARKSDYIGSIVCDRLPTFNRYSSADFLDAVDGITGYVGAYPNQNWIYAKANGATTADEFKTWLQSNPIEVVYELATPIEVDLTPTEIKTLLGQNNVWTDTNGDVTVVYMVE